jgi:hypothetical protein
MKFYYDQTKKMWQIGEKLLQQPRFAFEPESNYTSTTIYADGNVVVSEKPISSLRRKDGTSYQDFDTFINEVSPFFEQALDAGAIIYGVQRLRGSSDPGFMPIGNLDQHVSLPLHGMRKIVKVNSNRQVVNELLQTNINFNSNGTPSVLDGTDGCDIVIYNPTMYAILDGAGSSGLWERWIIGDRPFSYDGDVAMHINAYVDSADNATLESGVNRLRCVRNETSAFAGSGALSTAGGLGYPRTSISRYNMELFSQNKGDKWKGTYYRDHLVEAALMYIEYKTKNLKSVFGALGTGWSTSNWSAYNSTNPVLKVLEAQLTLSGRGDIVSKGHLTGTFAKTFGFSNDGTPVTQTTSFGCYRGKILRNGIWNHICGIEYEIESNEAGGKSGVYIQFNPDLIDNNRSNTSFAFKQTYEYMGLAPRVNGWSSATIKKTNQAATIGGGETTHDCKYFFTDIPTTGVSRRCVLEGGSLIGGSNVAFGSSFSYNAPSIAYSNFGVGFRADVAG